MICASEPRRSLFSKVPCLLADVARRNPLELFDQSREMERILEAALIGDLRNT